MAEVMASADEWTGCYDVPWKGIIVNDAFKHPAKIAKGLADRIYEHAVERGWIERGGLCIDPFGGIGGCALWPALHGVRWVGVELESTFVELAQANFALWKRRWGHDPDWVEPVMIQGDSRNLAGLLAGQASCVLSSPPYAQAQIGGGINVEKIVRTSDGKTRKLGNDGYNLNMQGQTPGQLGTMPIGNAPDLILSSPPYAETVKGVHRETETAEETRAKRKTAGGSLGQSQRSGGYGVSKGQLGALPVGDAPDLTSDVLVVKCNDSTTISGGQHEEHDQQRNIDCDVRKRPFDDPDRKANRQTAIDGMGETSETESKDTAIQSPGQMECPQIGDRISLFPNGYEPGPNCKLLRLLSVDDRPGNEAIRDQVSVERETQGEAASSIQTRSVERPVSQSDHQGQVPEVWQDSGFGDSPQERRSLRQSLGESGSSLQFLPHERNQAEVVGSEECGTADSQEQCANELEKQKQTADLILSSPPYEVGLGKEHTYRDHAKRDNDSHRAIMTEKGIADPFYGDSPQQLGNVQGDTFWAAAKIILAQTFSVLRPGGHAIWICKRFVRRGAIVEFPQQWAALCESVGFKLVCWHHAMLVKKGHKQKMIGGGEEDLSKARMSFFRRLHAKKYPHLAIQWEDVMCFVKEPPP